FITIRNPYATFLYSPHNRTDLHSSPTRRSSDLYTIIIDPDGANTGNETVTLYNIPPDVTGTISPGGPSVTVTITTPGQNGSLTLDRKSTRLNSSHVASSYAVFCMKKKNRTDLYS